MPGIEISVVRDTGSLRAIELGAEHRDLFDGSRATRECRKRFGKTAGAGARDQRMTERSPRACGADAGEDGDRYRRQTQQRAAVRRESTHAVTCLRQRRCATIVRPNLHDCGRMRTEVRGRRVKLSVRHPDSEWRARARRSRPLIKEDSLRYPIHAATFTRTD